MSHHGDRLTRRDLFGCAAAFVAAAAPLGSPLAQQPRSGQGQPAVPLTGQGDAGTLRDPTAAGRPRVATAAGDNDESIKRIERQLRCTCGCNLDVFTCRTTDFTCTYSPELHREVVALHDAGSTPQEIIDAFVAKYGERVLMAPKPVDFNLVGYLLPGAAMLAAGAGLAWVIGRRRLGRMDRWTDGQMAREPESGQRSAGPSDHQSIRPSQDELDRLRRDLAEVDD